MVKNSLHCPPPLLLPQRASCQFESFTVCQVMFARTDHSLALQSQTRCERIKDIQLQEDTRSYKYRAFMPNTTDYANCCGNEERALVSTPTRTPPERDDGWMGSCLRSMVYAPTEIQKGHRHTNLAGRPRSIGGASRSLHRIPILTNQVGPPWSPCAHKAYGELWDRL